MTSDEIRSFFNEILDIKHEIAAKEESIIAVQSKAERITYDYEKLMISSSGYKDRVADYSVQLVQLQEELQDLRNELIDSYAIAFKMIDLLSDPLCRATMIDHFINGKTIEMIADEYEYGRKSIFRFLRISYEEIAEKLPPHLIPFEYR